MRLRRNLIHTLDTHPRVHEDEAATVSALEKGYGGDVLQLYESWQLESFSSRAKDLTRTLENGYCVLGRGGGPFDDHVPGQDEECAFTLTMDFAGAFDGDQYLRDLGDLIRTSDRSSVREDLDLSKLIKLFSRLCGNPDSIALTGEALFDGLLRYWRELPRRSELNHRFIEGRSGDPETPRFSVRAFVTRDHMTFGDLATTAFLRRNGANRFPGMDDSTPIVTYNPSVHGGDAKEIYANGFLPIGVSNGLFGPTFLRRSDDRRTKFDCPFTRAVYFAGFGKDPVWRYLIREVSSADRRFMMRPRHFLNSHPKNLASIAEYFSLLGKTDTALEHISGLLFEAVVSAQESFLAAKEIVSREGSVDTIHNASMDKILKLYSIRGEDNEDINRAARLKHGICATLVVQMNAAGQVCIWPNRYILGDNSIEELVARLREREAELVNFSEPAVISRDALRSTADLRNWFYHLEAQAVYNGSLTAPDVPPTKIPFEEIVKICSEFLKETIFSRKRR